jgi:hypothetical protein
VLELVLILVEQEETDYLHLFLEQQSFMLVEEVEEDNKYHLVAQDLLEQQVLVVQVVELLVDQVLHLQPTLPLQQQQTPEVEEVGEAHNQFLV